MLSCSLACRSRDTVWVRFPARLGLVPFFMDTNLLVFCPSGVAYCLWETLDSFSHREGLQADVSA